MSDGAPREMKCLFGAFIGFDDNGLCSFIHGFHSCHDATGDIVGGEKG